MGHLIFNNSFIFIVTGRSYGCSEKDFYFEYWNHNIRKKQIGKQTMALIMSCLFMTLSKHYDYYWLILLTTRSDLLLPFKPLSHLDE